MGYGLAGIGDINNDSYDDFAMGAYLNDESGNEAGQTYVFYGNSSGWSANLSVANANASFRGASASDRSGLVVAGVGDVNKDGYSDFVITAYAADDGGTADVGKAYLIFGESGFSGTGLRDTNLSSLNMTTSVPKALMLKGEQASAQLRMAAGVGDLNADGIDDFVLGALMQDVSGRTDCGKVYLILGRSSGWADMPSNVGSAAAATFYGEASSDNLGIVAGAGDVNGDGKSDFLMSAPGNDDGGSGAGKVYLVFGTSNPASKWPSSVDLNTADADENIASFKGQASDDNLGCSIAGAGDVDSDGYDDILMGARFNDEGSVADRGQAYLVRGQSSAASWGVDINVGNMTHTGTPKGASFWGRASGDQCGNWLEGIGDYNGDGYDDFAIGAWSNNDAATDAGKTYVYYGRNCTTNPFVMDQQVCLADFALSGEWPGAGMSGARIARVGGAKSPYATGDFLISAPFWDDGGVNDTGKAYLVLASGYPPTQTPTPTYTITPTYTRTPTCGSAATPLTMVPNSFVGENSVDILGYGAAGIGDINGDGFDDFAMGAYKNDDNGADAGQTYIFLGTSQGWSAQLSVASANKSFCGSAGDFSGLAVAGVGDVDHDGYSDFVITSCQADDGGSSNVGKAYLVFGGSYVSDWTMDMNLSSLNTTTTPKVVVYKGEQADAQLRYVARAGDFNGDGYDDFVLGATLQDYSSRADCGKAYLILGRYTDWPTSITSVATGAVVTFIGKAGGDNLGVVGAVGDVNQDGLGDFLISATGYDDVGVSNRGRIYLVFGTEDPALTWGSSCDLSTLATDDGIASFKGEAADDAFGTSVSGSGDVDRDGYGDFLVGARFNDETASNAGQVYLIHGSATARTWGIDLNVQSLTPDPTGNDPRCASFKGMLADDQCGFSVEGIGDFNSDGYDDFAMSSWLNDNGGQSTDNKGKIHVFFGRNPSSSRFLKDTPVCLADVTLVGSQNGEQSGGKIAWVGGCKNPMSSGDFLVGAPFRSGPQPGKTQNGGVYLVLGTAYTPTPTPTSTRTPTNTPSVTPTIKYVDKNATGSPHDGTTWEKAFLTLTAAYNSSFSGSTEIWVADGTYTEAITLRANVPMYGGFRGKDATYSGESSRAERDPRLHETVVQAPYNSSSATVTAANGAILDGFTITKETGGPPQYHLEGGGISCTNLSSFTMRNCVLVGNIAVEDGGGMYVSQVPTLLIENCTFYQNADSGDGGALYLSGSGVTIKESVIKDNVSDVTGGGVYASGSTLLVRDSTIQSNTSNVGGGIALTGTSTLNLVRSTIADNHAEDRAGALSLTGTTAALYNCLIAKNSASSEVGGIRIDGQYSGSTKVINCTIVKNTCPGFQAPDGGVANYNSTNNSLIMTNTILAYNGGKKNNFKGAAEKVQFCCSDRQVGLYPMPGNLTIGDQGVDPGFVNENFDWHLSYESSCANMGTSDFYNANYFGTPVPPIEYLQYDLEGSSHESPFKSMPIHIGMEISPQMDFGCYEWPGDFAFGVTSMALEGAYGTHNPTTKGFLPIPPSGSGLAPSLIPGGYLASNVPPEKFDELIQTLKDLNVKMVRIGIFWSRWQPIRGQMIYEDEAFVTAPGCTTFQSIKTQVNRLRNDVIPRLRDEGFEVLVTFAKAPLWATSYPWNGTPTPQPTPNSDFLTLSNGDPGQYPPRPQPTQAGSPGQVGTVDIGGAQVPMSYSTDWGKFIRDLEYEFGDYVNYYCVWNEPNVLGWWPPNYDYPGRPVDSTWVPLETQAEHCWNLINDTYTVLDTINHQQHLIDYSSRNKVVVFTASDGFTLFGESCNENTPVPNFPPAPTPSWTPANYSDWWTNVIDSAGGVSNLNEAVDVIGGDFYDFGSPVCKTPTPSGNADCVATYVSCKIANWLDYEYRETPTPVFLEDGFECWITETGAARSWFKSSATATHTPLPGSTPRPVLSDYNPAMEWQRETIHKIVTSTVENFPAVKRVELFDLSDFDFGVPGNDSAAAYYGLITWHPGIRYQGACCNVPNPYMFDNYVIRYPAYYGFKAATSGMQDPDIPSITNLSSFSFTSPSNQNVTVTLSRSVCGNVWLMIDGIKIMSVDVSTPSSSIAFSGFTIGYNDYSFQTPTPVPTQQSILAAKSEYHRLGLAIPETGNFPPSISGIGIDGYVETAYRFVTLDFTTGGQPTKTPCPQITCTCTCTCCP